MKCFPIGKGDTGIGNRLSLKSMRSTAQIQMQLLEEDWPAQLKVPTEEQIASSLVLPSFQL